MPDEPTPHDESVAADVPTFTYSPVQPDWTPPAGPLRRHRLLGWGIAGSIIIVVALVAGLGIHTHRLGWEHSDYGYDIVERATVDASQPWVIDLPILLDAVSSSSVKIYSDPELTYPVPFAASTDNFTRTGRKRTLTPTSYLLDISVSLPLLRPTILGGDSWPGGTYYVAENQDFFGKTLDRPRVHVYTVPTSPESMRSPDFTMEVANGVPTFTWESVPGASMYYILKSTPRPTDDPKLTIIGWAHGDATSWTSIDQDVDYKDTYQNQGQISSYNAEFQGFDMGSIVSPCHPQDIDYRGQTPPAWDNSALTFPSYAVVVRGDTDHVTSPKFLDGRDLIATTPISSASRTLNQMSTDAGTTLFVPQSFPVTMGDCRTVFFPVVGQWMARDFYNQAITLSYVVTGTRLTHQMAASGDSPSTVQDLGASLGLTMLTQQVVPTQDLGDFGEPLPDETPSVSAPDSPYSWNGTSDMVKFIAANMYAGTTAIDLSSFTADPSNPLIADAANEAFYQNPYITDYAPTIEIQNDVLYIGYRKTAEERAASAARVKAKVDQIIGSIITESMSERDKALEITRYLAQNAVYDYDAVNFMSGHTTDEIVRLYPNSWDAGGVLVDGKGVCSSYAAGFKALADAAGLDSVTIVGSPDGTTGGHEWVKVRVDGSWWIIDPTWSASVGDSQTYFMLTDSETPRVEFNGFVVDAYVANYNTP